MTEDEMFGWHHQFDGNEFEQAPGNGVGQGSLVCCSPWDCKELNTTEQATVRTGHGTTDWLKTRKGVCQGCILFI